MFLTGCAELLSTYHYSCYIKLDPDLSVVREAEPWWVIRPRTGNFRTNQTELKYLYSWFEVGTFVTQTI